MADEVTGTTAVVPGVIADPAKTTETAPQPDAGATVLGDAKADATTKIEEKKSEDKAVSEAPKAPALDLKSIKLPEGFVLDEKLGNDFVSVLSDDKLAPQDRAQKLFDLHTQQLKAQADAPLAAWRNTNEQWQKDIAADKDIGSGDTKTPLKAEHVTAIGRLIDAHGGNELRQALFLTGAGNNPVIVKAFVNFAKLLTEGGHVSGRSAPQTATAAELMYPDLPKG